jgi:hypothetical protein
MCHESHLKHCTRGDSLPCVKGLMGEPEGLSVWCDAMGEPLSGNNKHVFSLLEGSKLLQ